MKTYEGNGFAVRSPRSDVFGDPNLHANTTALIPTATSYTRSCAESRTLNLDIYPTERRISLIEICPLFVPGNMIHNPSYSTQDRPLKYSGAARRLGSSDQR